jgi:hypothetical protein
LGGGGVKIGETSFSDQAAVLAGHNTVRNCVIAHFGRLHPAAVGVWIGQSPHNVIDHNTIVDGYYTGVSLGWSWGYGPSAAQDNAITNNRISQIGQGVLSDMGGVYTLGVSPGTIVNNNVIHNINSFDYGAWGIYFDEGTTGVIAESNLVYRTKSAEFHQHYGKDNVLRNNIFVDGGEAQLMRTRSEDHLSFTISNNVIVANDAPVLAGNWSGTRDQFRLDSNLYWNLGKDALSFAGKSFADWQKSGQDASSIVADPLFVDAAHDNYNLRPDSPAFKIGFKAFDEASAGAHDKNDNAITLASLGAAPRAFPAPPPPLPVADDFENGAVGTRSSLITSEESETATARLSDEQSSPFAPGRQSLKFIDEAGQKQTYNPHVYAQPKMKGALIGRFDIRPDARATIYHEWRDNQAHYHVGPSLEIKDNTLQAHGKALMKLQDATWYRCEIHYTTGTNHWSLRVRSANGAWQNFDDLSCDAGMKSLDWWGFVSDGTTPAVWYLDNVSVAAE